MQEEELTTAPSEEQVNNDEITTEEVVDDPSVNPDDSGNDTGSDEYSKAWDDIDIDNFSMPEETTNEVEEPQVDLNQAEPANVEDIKDTLNAFMVDKPMLKFKGKDIPIDSADELIALAQKGFSYENEMSKIKPQKKRLNIIESVPEDALQALADLHSGNKNAIDYLKKTYGIEDVKVDTGSSFFNDSEETSTSPETDYKPEVKQEDPVLTIWEQFKQNSPSADSGRVEDIYDQLDNSFKAEIYKPEVLPQFISSVVSGEFDKVYPIAVKEKAMNHTLTWLQAYSLAASKVGSQEPKKSKPKTNVEVPQTQESGRKISESAAADKIWEDDKHYNELYNSVFKF